MAASPQGSPDNGRARPWFVNNISSGDVIQIILILSFVLIWGVRLEDKVNASDRMNDRQEAVIQEMIRLDHDRDIQLGKLMQESGVK